MKKKNPRKALKAKLDKLWSAVIRKKYPRCVVCGKSDNLNAHHCIVRKAQSDGVRWLVENGVSLCVGCHLFKLHGQQADKAWLENYLCIINDLVSETQQELIQEIGHKINKFSIDDLEQIKAELEEQLK